MLLRVPPTSVPAGALITIALFRAGASDYFLARSDDETGHRRSGGGLEMAFGQVLGDRTGEPRHLRKCERLEKRPAAAEKVKHQASEHDHEHYNEPIDRIG